jgi:hypothetical protein
VLQRRSSIHDFGSCVLLNNAAVEQVREPGKFLIRRAVIEKIG